MFGKMLMGKEFVTRLPLALCNKFPSSCIVPLMTQGYATKSKQQETLPDADYNFWKKLAPKKYPKIDHWRSKMADIRWQYLQDPEVQKGVVPIIYKETPERDAVNWPTPVPPENTGRIRMFLLPEEFFNFLYSKTGVTGPYVIVWGTLGYLWSQEMLRLDSEAATILYFTLVPMFFYHRVIVPRMHTYMNRSGKFEEDAFRALLDYNKGKLELQNINDRLDFEMNRGASKYTFEAKKEMFELQWESTYRKRLYEAYDKVKQRLDFHAEVDACKARHESKHMVNWIVESVRASITPQQEAATLAKCMVDLKAMSSTVQL